MTLTQLDSQIEGLRAQAASILKRGRSFHTSVTTDRALTEIGKREKLDTERARIKTQLSDLRARERELIDSKRESLERQLFGLSTTASSDPNQLIAYRDAQDRAAKLGKDSTAAAALLASATRSGDRTLAAAIAAHALAFVEPHGVMGSNGWNNIINDYAEHYPSDGDKLTDLLKLRNLRSAKAVFAYMPPF
ncbi:hypothetical protein [Mycolicibacterium bacteremicum]|uniref:hypothetical protein n=1 Tax=Mycolicibacterium bacteremicum TaxID=564198 RepID=UPI0026EB1303|nr:hypothetical protein [Mycolicibacterium bacteremicum]